MDAQHRDATAAQPFQITKPTTLRASFALHFAAAAATLAATLIHLITMGEIHLGIGPLTYGIAVVGGSLVLGLVFFISAMRGTSGNRRGRIISTCLLALSPVLLFLGPLMIPTVVISVAALALLWVPASNGYIRAVTAAGSARDRDPELAALMNSRASGRTVPWPNAMPGNPPQAGI